MAVERYGLLQVDEIVYGWYDQLSNIRIKPATDQLCRGMDQLL